MCFLVNITKFLKTAFFIETSGGCFYSVKRNTNFLNDLTHFILMFHFYALQRQKTEGFCHFKGVQKWNIVLKWAKFWG